MLGKSWGTFEIVMATSAFVIIFLFVYFSCLTGHVSRLAQLTFSKDLMKGSRDNYGSRFGRFTTKTLLAARASSLFSYYL